MTKTPIQEIQRLSFPWQTDDPFLFCAYHRDEYPAGNAKMEPDRTLLAGRSIGSDFQVKDGWRMYHGRHIPGFPYHPHRGFETITINKEGFVDHTDSLGAAGRFGAGDVQWMTAGRGLQHSEMFPLVNEERENPLEIFQIWLNLPKVSKMVEPHFKMLWAEEVPKFTKLNGQGEGVTVDIIAGSLEELAAPNPTPNSWAADPAHGVNIWTIKIDPGTTWHLPGASSPDFTRSLYFYRGSDIKCANKVIGPNHRIVLDPIQDVEISVVDAPAYFLFLQGSPIQEPVAQHGPFVMNTAEEIQEAFAEFRRTEFGGWPWPQREQVHPRDKGRFAKYPDGREETPS